MRMVKGVLSALSLVKHAGALLNRETMFGVQPKPTPCADAASDDKLSLFVSGLQKKAETGFGFGALSKSWSAQADARPSRSSSSSASASSSASGPAEEPTVGPPPPSLYNRRFQVEHAILCEPGTKVRAVVKPDVDDYDKFKQIGQCPSYFTAPIPAPPPRLRAIIPGTMSATSLLPVWSDELSSPPAHSPPPI